MKLSRIDRLMVAAAVAVALFCAVRLTGELSGGGYRVLPEHPDRAVPSSTPRVYRLDAPIDLNTAGLSDLKLLPGIGQTKAQAILDYREANGPFSTLDDLVNVPGIGPATLEELRPHITLSAP